MGLKLTAEFAITDLFGRQVFRQFELVTIVQTGVNVVDDLLIVAIEPALLFFFHVTLIPPELGVHDQR